MATVVAIPFLNTVTVPVFPAARAADILTMKFNTVPLLDIIILVLAVTSVAEPAMAPVNGKYCVVLLTVLLFDSPVNIIVPLLVQVGAPAPLDCNTYPVLPAAVN